MPRYQRSTHKATASDDRKASDWKPDWRQRAKKNKRNRYKLHRNRNRLNARAKRNEIVVHQSGPRLVLVLVRALLLP